MLLAIAHVPNEISRRALCHILLLIHWSLMVSLWNLETTSTISYIHIPLNYTKSWNNIICNNIEHWVLIATLLLKFYAGTNVYYSRCRETLDNVDYDLNHTISSEPNEQSEWTFFEISKLLSSTLVDIWASIKFRKIMKERYLQ